MTVVVIPGEEQATSKTRSMEQAARDFSSMWSFDISAELDQYRAEVDQKMGATGEHVNFAEAGIVVQGTANIYSKKVESLYNQVHESLQILGKEMKKKRNSSKAVADFEDDDYMITTAMVTFHNKSQNLYDPVRRVESESLSDDKSIRRVPLFLIPRESTDRN